MNISKETRDALVNDLSLDELRAEIDRRTRYRTLDVQVYGTINGRTTRSKPEGAHLYVRRLQETPGQWHVIAANGKVLWLDDDAINELIGALVKISNETL
jgi:hypothetical protein